MFKKLTSIVNVSYTTPTGPTTDPLEFSRCTDDLAVQNGAEPLLKLKWKDFEFSGATYEECYGKLRQRLAEKSYTDIRFS